MTIVIATALLALLACAVSSPALVSATPALVDPPAGSARSDTLRVGLSPAEFAVDVGDTFQVEIAILESGPEFNAYDAVVGFDPAVLTFLGTTPITDQEGPLMTEACPTRFHVFTVADDSTTLSVNHALLCAGVTVTGPGVLYRLHFRCDGGLGQTELTLEAGPGQTRFYDDGLTVEPLVASGAVVLIDDPTATPRDVPAGSSSLRAVPNPFNPRTAFEFELAEQQSASLRVYALDGRLVRTLQTGPLAAGRHRITWDGRDRHGRPMPSGRYTARLVTDRHTETRPVTLVR